VSDVLALPFDQYQRYRLVADLLAQLRGEAKQLTVLDVGGRTAVLREFMPEARITLVDMEASSEPGLVLGDGSRLPFADDSFDVVAAFDTLEHVPPPRRKAFVAECARVAKRWAVICGPYEAPRVVEAEQLLQRFLHEKLGQEHRYLEEHRHHGLPVRAKVEEQLRAAGAKVASIGHANLDRWLVLQCLSMFMDYDPALRPLAQAFQRYYNRSLYASDHAEPVYRHAIVAAFDGAPIPSAGDLLGPAHAPEGALPPFFELAGELVRFDRERDAWHVERDALRKMADDLRADLSGHHASLETRERETAAQAALIAELRADLEGHRRKISELHLHVAGHEASADELQKAYDSALEHQANLERDLAGHRAALAEARRSLEEEQRGGAAARQALAGDLDGHKRMLAELRAMLARDAAGHERTLAELAAVRAALERDLQGHRDALAATQADLAGHRRALELARGELASSHARGAELEAAVARADAQLRATLALAAGLESSLAQREEVYDKLQAELRSRWKNLKRVFRLR
jgi:chromosome segregation ATPase